MTNGKDGKLKSLDFRSILAIVTLFLGSNVGTGVIRGHLSSGEIQVQKQSASEYSMMWESVLETSNECHDDLRSCYQSCSARTRAEEISGLPWRED
jgi:hypothetical protein